MIFRTNQHTDQHFIREFEITELKPHISAIISGIVSKKPFYIEGSHLIFSIKDDTGEIDCAAYEPTKRFRGQLSNLIEGDKVKIYGGIRPASEKHPITVNVEKIEIKELKSKFIFENPFCEKCGSRLKSAGKNKGFKCPKCSTRYRNKLPSKIELERNITAGIIIPPIVAHRHLLRPEIRSKRNNGGNNLNFTDINQILNELICKIN
jgi:tRNA(Ile2)-agmatinylcytidine synthase